MSLHESYDVEILRMADGEIRRCHQAHQWHDDEEHGSTLSWWTVGNMACDCNRYLEFERAGGANPRPSDESIQCGDGAYRVLRILFPDGTALAVEPI